MAPFDAALLSAVLVVMTPLLIAATGELVSQTSGVINIGLEGMVLSGAFTAFVVAKSTGSLPLGFAAGVGGGLVAGVVMAVLAIEAKVDQIVVGIGIDLLAIGMTSFLNAHLYETASSTPLHTLGHLEIPVLSEAGGIGKALFDQDVFVYGSFVLLGVVAFVIYRTAWGIGLRAVGENPAAADAAGVSVRGLRWCGVLTAAGLGGLAGAYLSIGEVGIFRDQMTAGRGFLALTAVLFARWRPIGVLLACGIFAFTDALQLRLQGFDALPRSVWIVVLVLGAAAVVYGLQRRRRSARRGATGGRPAPWLVFCAIAAVLVATNPHLAIPTNLWLAAPFILALIALATAGTERGSMPSALALPFSRADH